MPVKITSYVDGNGNEHQVTYPKTVSSLGIDVNLTNDSFLLGIYSERTPESKEGSRS
jgi:hypothetical protein